jgi:hypothetical protein
MRMLKENNMFEQVVQKMDPQSKLMRKQSTVFVGKGQVSHLMDD